MTNVLVPMYVYPDLGQPNSQWQKLAQLAIAYPKTEIWSAVNPASGPGTTADANYTNGIRVLHQAGVKLLGYVDTARAKLLPSAVIEEVGMWVSLYSGTKLDGIFYDDVENTISQEYYWKLTSDLRGSGLKAFGNPGTSIPESYIGIFDTAVIWENSTVPAAGSVYTPGYDKKNFACLIWSQPAPTPASVNFLNQYFGYVYVTSGTQPNPYNGIPYLQSLLAALQ